MIRPNYWGVVMRYKVLIPAIWVCALTATLAGADSLLRLGGPANLPPSGFGGQQFVDNRGCLFLRAGFGTTINWVPRVDRSHNPLCGYPPTFGPGVAAAVASDMAPDAQAQVVTAQPVVTAQAVVSAPVQPVAVAPLVVTTQPVVVAEASPPQVAPRRGWLAALPFGEPAQVMTEAPAPAAEVAASQPGYAAVAGPASGQVLCFATAPRLEQVLLRSGDTAHVCTRGDGTLTGWLSPLYPAGPAVGAALGNRKLTGQAMVGATLLGHGVAASVVASRAIPLPPKGYKLAWQDDRLNPLRGIGTADGQAQQDLVWTRTVPMVLVSAQPKRRGLARVLGMDIGVSTMSAPEQARGVGLAYVQIGSFGVPDNAEAAKARLVALGLPVAVSRTTSSGRALQTVLAGPFAGPGDATAALAEVRAAGFGDAVLR